MRGSLPQGQRRIQRREARYVVILRERYIGGFRRANVDTQVASKISTGMAVLCRQPFLNTPRPFSPVIKLQTRRAHLHSLTGILGAWVPFTAHFPCGTHAALLTLNNAVCL